MFLRKVFLFLMTFGLSYSIFLPAASLQLARVNFPTAVQINKEKDNLNKRQLKRYAVKISTTAGVLVMMYVTIKASEYFKEMGKHLESVDQRVAVMEKGAEFRLKKFALGNLVEKKEPDVLPQQAPSFSFLAPAKWFVGGVKACAIGTKDFGKDLGKFIIESCPAFVASMVLSTLWQQVCNRVVEASKAETLLWYIEKHTQARSLFHDISLGSIPFDLHSELLSLQQIHDKAGNHMHSYVADLTELEKDNDLDSIEDGYFAHSCDELKKNYAKKGAELAKLQDYAVPNIAKKKRAINGSLDDASLFLQKEAEKQNLVDLCNLLTQQIQKVVSFAVMHIDKRRSVLPNATIVRGEKKIGQMIECANRYLDAMEKMLQMEFAELEGMSVANKGMFTCTYEFEKLFREQVAVLHRYCSLIS